MTSDYKIKLADQTTEDGFRNPLGFHCAPNATDPSYASEHDFGRFIAFGLYISHFDQNDLEDYAFGRSEINDIRRQFLDTVENAITLRDKWERQKKFLQDEPVGEVVDLYKKGTEDAEDRDHDDVLTISWTLYSIAADEAWCFDLHFTGTNDPISIWLDGEMLESGVQRDECLKYIKDVRKVLGFEREGVA